MVKRNTALALAFTLVLAPALALAFICTLGLTDTLVVSKGTLSEKKLKLVQGELTVMISRVPDARQAPQTGRPSSAAMETEAEVDGEGEQREKGEEEAEGVKGVEGKGGHDGDGDGGSNPKPTSPDPTGSQRSVRGHGGKGSPGANESLFGGTITLRFDLHDAPDPVHEWWESTDNEPKVNALLQGEVVGAAYSNDLHESDDAEIHAQVNDELEG